MKHAWNHTLVDHAGINSDTVEEIYIQDFKELLEQDQELEHDMDNNVDSDVVMI